MSESYQSKTTDLAAFLIGHMEKQHKNVTTVRTIRKATRNRPSTLVVRKGMVIPARVKHTTWTYDPEPGRMNTTPHDGNTGANFHSVNAGGQLRLSDLHK